MAAAMCVVVALTGCQIGERLPDRRAVDPLNLIYGESRFAGASDFADLKATGPPLRDKLPGWPPNVSQLWRGAALQIREIVTIHVNANKANTFFNVYTPRNKALELVRDKSLVGKPKRYAAPGSPARSQVMCAYRAPDDRRQCLGWVWWARYGQYTVALYAEPRRDNPVIDGGQFERVVNLAAAHIGKALGA